MHVTASYSAAAGWIGNVSSRRQISARREDASRERERERENNILRKGGRE